MEQVQFSALISKMKNYELTNDQYAYITIALEFALSKPEFVKVIGTRGIERINQMIEEL